MILNNKKSGFTLIELLIVIVIISILTSIIIASINQARVKARDTQRISDIKQLRIALELYKNTNGDYPLSSSWLSSSNSSWTTLETALAPFMPKLPIDPKNTGNSAWVTGEYVYNYFYDPTGYPVSRSYDLVAQLENTSSPLRSEVKPWIFHVYELPWNNFPSYSPYVYTGEQQ